MNELYIKDSPSINAQGGQHAAGIGSGALGESYYISIDGNVNLTCNGGTFASGIGGGFYGSSKKILITGNGNISANGNVNAAGIGGGFYGSGGTIEIGGLANISAVGYNGADDIGNGNSTGGICNRILFNPNLSDSIKKPLLKAINLNTIYTNFELINISLLCNEKPDVLFSSSYSGHTPIKFFSDNKSNLYFIRITTSSTQTHTKSFTYETLTENI